MNLQSIFGEWGERVDGYDIPVINEREARAAAGILGMLGTIIIFVGIGFNHVIVARIYLAFLFIDFVARVFNPRYSPSLLLGKFIVRKQKPEYVGAPQKHFAWAMGWMISFPMIYWFVGYPVIEFSPAFHIGFQFNWDITFYKVLICVLCITLMFLESAFAICVGCVIYKLITRKQPQHCPGGVCEMRVREPIQMFNPVQKVIASVTFVALLTGIYFFLAKTESKTFFGAFLHDLVLTKEQLKKEEDLKFEQQMAQDFGDDEDDF